MKRKRQIDLRRFTGGLLTLLLLCSGQQFRISAGEDADFRKAQGYYTLQEYKLAVDAFKAYLTAHPKSERSDQAALLLAESQFQLKQYPDAAAAYDGFLAAYPASARRPDALLRALRIHFLLKNYTASLAACETFLKEFRPKIGKEGAHPELPTQVATALYYAGESQYGLKKAAEAQKTWEDLLKNFPDSKLIPDASEGLGWIYFDTNQFDAALARFKVTASTPKHPRAGWAMLMQGRALAGLKKYNEAVEAYKAAPAVLPGVKEIELEVALRSAEALLGAQDYPGAVAAYANLAKVAPDVPSTPLALAAATYQVYDGKKFAETIQVANAYLSLKGGAERPAILRVKARSALALGNQAEAAEIAKEAVTVAGALPEGGKKPEEHGAALVLLAELSGKGGAGFYETAAKAYPSTRYGLTARYELARLAAQENQVDAALGHVTALLDALKNAGAEASPGLKQDALFAAGEFAFRKGDYKQAEVYLNDYAAGAKEDDPRGDDIARKRAWCRHEQKDAAQAAKILDAALAKYPQSALRDEMLYLRAQSAAAQNDAKGAAEFGDALLKAFPGSPFADDALYERAVARFKGGLLNEAIADLTQLMSLKGFDASPLRPAALQLRATAYLQTGKSAEAAADADAALKNATEKSPALELLRALALSAQAGKETEAIDALSKLAAAAPSSPEGKQALLRRAYLHFGAKNFAKARADFEAYLKADAQPGTERLESEIRLAVCLRELKDTAAARALLERLAANNPQLNRYGFEINSQLGNLQFEAKDYAKAGDSYAVALTCAEKSAAGEIPSGALAATTLNLAWCQRYLKNGAAEKSFAAVIKQDPDGPFAAEALLEYGRILDDAGKAEEALKAWTQVIEKHAGSEQAPRALLLKAQRLAKLARFADAAPVFEQFLARNGTDKAAREAWSGLAECRLQQGNASGAGEAFLKVLGEKGLEAELDEPGERAILGLAELNLRKGDGLNAKKLALRVLTERPGSAWTDAALFTAGQASEALGEPERAIGYFRKMLADFPQSAQAQAAKDRLKALGAGEK